MRLNRRHVVWATVALLGLAAPAALTFSITRLTGQHIGLTAQPLSVIKGLAPARREGQDEARVVKHPAGSVHGKRRRGGARPTPGVSTDTAIPSSVSGTAPTGSSSPTGSLATSVQSAPAATSQAPSPGTSTTDRASQRQRGDDSSGGSLGGPDD